MCQPHPLSSADNGRQTAKPPEAAGNAACRYEREACGNRGRRGASLTRNIFIWVFDKLNRVLPRPHLFKSSVQGASKDTAQPDKRRPTVWYKRAGNTVKNTAGEDGSKKFTRKRCNNSSAICERNGSPCPEQKGPKLARWGR